MIWIHHTGVLEVQILEKRKSKSMRTLLQGLTCGTPMGFILTATNHLQLSVKD